MASRAVVKSNLLTPAISCLFRRRLNTLPTPISTTSVINSSLSSPEKISITTPAGPAGPAGATTVDKDKIIDFDNLSSLFDKVKTGKLLKSSLILQMAANETLVDTGSWVMNSGIMKTPGLKEMILAGIKYSFFQHFVAGEGLEEAGEAVRVLSEVGLRGMLDYGLEHANDNQSCDRNVEEFIKTIQFTKSLPSVSFIVVKISAICPPSLLRRVSDLLRWEYKNSTTFSLPWKHKTLPIFADSSPLYHTSKQPHPLTQEEEQNLQLAHQRLSKICEKCIEANVPLLVDAEETTLQPAIDYFTYSSCVTYQRGDNDSPLVFGTVQAYMKDAKERLMLTKKAADKMGIPIGFKLVRGAYMSFEKQVSDSLGVESPIHNSIEETHDSFNSCAGFMLEEVAKGPGAVVLATHNVESGKLAAAKAVDLGIKKEDGKLEFAQLYGMADTLSFSLRNAGMQVSKYLPFGPVDQIIPYLLRRAEENRGVLSASYLDSNLMRKEISRRIKSFTY